MEKQRNPQVLIIVVLSLAILTMSIGFASMNKRPNETTNVHYSGGTWNVAFDDASKIVVTNGSVMNDLPSVTGTSVSFDVTFNEPGQFYEFVIPITNNGTYDAELDSIVMSSLTESQKEYLKYTVDYIDSSLKPISYTESTSSLAKTLRSGITHALTVRVEYSSEEILNEPINISLMATLQYKPKLS